MECHETSSFITLTYNQDNLPENRSVDKTELQRFFKRLRKKVNFRYFACGEYGKQRNRPHYHAIIFGYDFPDKRLYSRRNENSYYRSEQLEKLWPYGFSTIGTATFESAAYVARYVTKKYRNKDEQKVKDAYTLVNDETGEVYDLEPEFCIMSRGNNYPHGHPKKTYGIGYQWLQKYKQDTNKDYITVRGKKMALPKYYDYALEKYYQDDAESRKLKRLKAIDKSEQTYSRLQAKETVKKAQIGQLHRTLEDTN